MHTLIIHDASMAFTTTYRPAPLDNYTAKQTFKLYKNTCTYVVCTTKALYTLISTVHKNKSKIKQES